MIDNMMRRGDVAGVAAHKEDFISITISDRETFDMSNYSENSVKN